MLERYYAMPGSIDRIRALWLGPAIERYAVWLAERRISGARGRGCIEILIQFDRFAQAHGAQEWSSLPTLVDSFVAYRLRQRARPRDRHELQTLRSQFRLPVEQLLRLAVPGVGGDVIPRDFGVERRIGCERRRIAGGDGGAGVAEA
jgi:hypothetical protein